MRRVTDSAVEVLPPDESFTPAWHEARRNGISSSDIAAVLGLSPYVSPFDLYWEKKTTGSQAENAAMRRGKRYERLILDDFQDEHEEYWLQEIGLCRNDDRPWQFCTPDALAYETTIDVNSLALALVEAKSGARRDEWGEPGTDAIPIHYKAQVIWALDCLGLPVAYVPVLFGFDFKVYEVWHNEADAKVMREAAQRFLDDLANDCEPPIDSHTATTRRLKMLHPSLVDDEAEVPAEIIRNWQLADRIEKRAKDRRLLAENKMRALMGSSRIATIDGKKVASRSVTELPDRVQTVRAYTRDTLYVTKKDIA